MGQIDALFFNYPARLFHIREISRLTGIPKTTVANKIKQLLVQNILVEDKDVFTAYRANEQNSKYRNKKKLFVLGQIFESGLIDFLEEELSPKSIILFGSLAKGEYTASSDLDVFLECEEQELDLSVFEKKLGRGIHFFMYAHIQDVAPLLANNIINGVRLSGFVKVF